MYFIKRHFFIIITFTLLIGAIGTLVSAFLIPQTYAYEEHYIFDEQVSGSQYSEISAQVNENINMAQDTIVAEVDHVMDSSTIILRLNEATAETIDTVRAEFSGILDANNLSYSNGNGMVFEPLNNLALQISIIVISLIIGAIVGSLVSVNNRRIYNDEDTKYYLDQKTLGTF